jgi:hypothetical protein
MAPSGVNDSMRQMMAETRRWYEDPAWIDYGYTYTYVSTTSFKVSATDVTANFVVGRRVRIVGTSTGTIYGAIATSVFSTDTTVTVTLDSGTIANETLAVSIGMPSLGNPITIANAAIIAAVLTGYASGAGTVASTDTILAAIQKLNGNAALKALLTTNTFSAAQIGTPTALTSTSNSMAIDLSAANNFSHTFTENTTLANPSNPVAGQSGCIALTQHASSAKTLAYGNQWIEATTGTAPTVSTTVGAQNLLSYYVFDSTHIYYTLNKHGVT